MPALTADLPRVHLPAAATLRYAVTGLARGLPHDTQSELRWQPQAGQYDATWTTEAVGGRRAHQWHSQGAVTPVGLLPERFAETSRGERAAHFDAAGGRIHFSANTPDALWSVGGQDRLSAVLQLGALLAAEPARYPPGTQITLQTAGARDADAWAWTVLGDDTLTVDGQPLPCAVLQHLPSRPYEATQTLWLARPLQYLPARLRVVLAQGDVLEHNLQNLSDRP